MAFKPAQVRKLSGKLPERFVKTRSEHGMTLSYVEGWHVIDEANRVFGFDGWDRETVSAECVWQDARITPKACSYAVRVRIKVRAGKTTVSREGTGIGHGTGATLGEAHESALKEAETDATKRALVTFGNPFGLALYDKDQAGVQRAETVGAAPVVWTLITGKVRPQVCETPQQFCSAAKATLRQARSLAELEALWTGNAPTMSQLRAVRPQLRTRTGAHYADLLERLYRQQQSIFEVTPTATTAAPEMPQDDAAARSRAQAKAEPPAAPLLNAPAAQAASSVMRPAEVPGIDAAQLIVTPRRVRDGDHLKRIAALPCLVCGRTPSHAHHLRFAQLRSLGSKPGDQWTVPLCPIHHRSLHDAGREDEWWQAKEIDAKAEAEKLWRTTHPAAAVVAAALTVPVGEDDRPSSEADTTGPKTPPIDNEGQPVPVRLQIGSADRS